MENMIGQGIELAILGMGTVFIFLALLILATHSMSALVLKYLQEEADVAAGTVTQANSSELLAVITAAITQHKNRIK